MQSEGVGTSFCTHPENPTHREAWREPAQQLCNYLKLDTESRLGVEELRRISEHTRIVKKPLVRLSD
jgi:hypothetical protein